MATNDVLFVHNNFPGQFGFLAQALKARGWRGAAIGSRSAKGDLAPVRRWKLSRGTTSGIFPFAVRAEADLMRAQAAANCALAYKQEGFDPRLIIGHPGWGETLLLKEIFPDAKQILHAEFYYVTKGGDVGFDPEFGTPTLEENFRVLAKNATMAMAYAEADAIVSPTAFQASFFPVGLRSRLNVIHEGIDTEAIRPRAEPRFVLQNGRALDRSVPVVTFINRNFEPMRGYHIFMRALPRVMAEVPEAQIVFIGSDGRGYGAEAPQGTTWRRRLTEEVGDRLDASRLHFTGRVPHDRMLDALAVSSAHVYYTYPFVLSWSLLEAMAMECVILGSDTPPLRDAVTPGADGVLNDFFDVDALSDAIVRALREPPRYEAMRKAARATVVRRFDRASVCLPAWLKLIDDVASA